MTSSTSPRAGDLSWRLLAVLFLVLQHPPAWCWGVLCCTDSSLTLLRLSFSSSRLFLVLTIRLVVLCLAFIRSLFSRTRRPCVRPFLGSVAMHATPGTSLRGLFGGTRASALADVREHALSRLRRWLRHRLGGTVRAVSTRPAHSSCLGAQLLLPFLSLQLEPVLRYWNRSMSF